MTREDLEDLAREMLAEARMDPKDKDVIRAKMRAAKTCQKRAFLKEEAEEVQRYFKRLKFGIYDCRNCDFWHLTTNKPRPHFNKKRKI